MINKIVYTENDPTVQLSNNTEGCNLNSIFEMTIKNKIFYC